LYFYICFLLLWALPIWLIFLQFGFYSLRSLLLSSNLNICFVCQVQLLHIISYNWKKTHIISLLFTSFYMFTTMFLLKDLEYNLWIRMIIIWYFCLVILMYTIINLLTITNHLIFVMLTAFINRVSCLLSVNNLSS